MAPGRLSRAPLFASTGRKRYNPNVRDNLKLYIFLSSMIEHPETNPVSGTMKVS